MIHRTKLTLLVLFTVFIGGCQAPLPIYSPMSAQESIDIIAQRFHSFEVAHVFGEMKLISNDGRQASVDYAVIHDHTRMKIRIWKMSTSIYDLTVLENGVWVYEGFKDQGRSITIDSYTIIQAWNLYMGSLFLDSTTHQQYLDEHTIVFRQLNDSMDIQSTMNRRNLIIERYTIERASNTPLIMELGRYRIIHGSPWPTRMSLIGPDGTIEITIKDLSFSLAESGYRFKPSKRAEKIR